MGRSLRVLVGVVAATLVAGGCASAGRVSTSSPTVAPGSAVAPGGSELSSQCRLPKVSSSAGPGQVAFSGPAVTALTGGAATVPLSLDNGSFELTPPPPGTRPTMGRASVECEALASSEMDGTRFGGDALRGMAIGYGLVTVSPSVQTSNPLFDQERMPKMPATPTYDRRLAWVVVVSHQEVASCPEMRVSSSPTTTAARPSTWGYAIFLADANTGADALVYTEAAPRPCGGAGLEGPFRSIPVETISVPWTLVSRDPSGYSGRIVAQIPACWTVPGAVDVERASSTVEVTASAIPGEICGRARPVSLTLDADTVFDDLPAHLVPAPLGPLTQSAAPPPPAAATNTGQIVVLTPQQNGTTLTVHVGDVLVAQPPLIPLPSPGQPSGDLIRSSNAGVIGITLRS